MRKLLSLFCLLLIVSGHLLKANEPDSTYLFAYSAQKSSGNSGLLFAWSHDRKTWHSIGNEFRFLACDYGRWGSEKRMYSPYLFQDAGKTWHCVWSLNDRDGVFAHASSQDLIYWKPQDYPEAPQGGNCLSPMISGTKNGYKVSWIRRNGNQESWMSAATNNFKTYSNAEVDNQVQNNRSKVTVKGAEETGPVSKVSWALVDGLIRKQQLEAYRSKLYSESPKDDATRYPNLKPLDATFSVNGNDTKKISDKLIGVFFEDINYAADGGLYAELVQNRDFEYALSDKEGRDKNWNSTKAWTATNATFSIDTVAPIHANNTHYAILKSSGAGAVLSNEGFDGIALKAGDKYDFSMFVKGIETKKVLVRIANAKGEVAGEAMLTVSSANWKKVQTVITATKTIADGRLEILPQNNGVLALDMISLFPQKTFKNRKNGLRADLAQLINDIHPRFVRFPGGCVAHGDGIGNIYRWKNTIGKLEARKPARNLWGYHQSMGLGYYEYFQFCEDMGAEPLPVIAAGVPCQNSAVGGAGQQGGVAKCDMDQYIQDILDLVEWANGDVHTHWGKIRAEAGHPKPFNLKYVGIGNEDLISEVFEERYVAIVKAMKAKHPEITVVGTVGPFNEGTDYEEGWRIASEQNIPVVDEHYYQSPGWFINNQDFYDRYDRNKAKVYLGEYASRGNTMTNALAEALYMTSLERNGDVVSMSSYAPLLAKEGHTQWNPDMIYFNNTEAKPTVNYYVQKMYGQNAGDLYLASDVKLSDSNPDVRKRIAMSVVKDSKTGDVMVKLVNVLPVAINAKVNLEGVAVVPQLARKTVLTGDLNEKHLQPTTGTVQIDKAFDCQLPAYSFTVIRIRGEKVGK